MCAIKLNGLHFVFVRSLAQSFPTPMEEPKKVLKAQYLGATEVNQPTGMDVLNAAIETTIAEMKREQWENVNVAVAPSMISINSSEVFTMNAFQITHTIRKPINQST